MSPEVRAHSGYLYNTDCWSLGCVLYELITLKRFHREDRIETNDVIQREITDLKTLNLFEILLSNMLKVERENRAKSERLKVIFDEN
jgi:serine/threonine protein kinase